jgi:hypothetical protein
MLRSMGKLPDAGLLNFTNMVWPGVVPLMAKT